MKKLLSVAYRYVFLLLAKERARTIVRSLEAWYNALDGSEKKTSAFMLMQTQFAEYTDTELDQMIEEAVFDMHMEERWTDKN